MFETDLNISKLKEKNSVSIYRTRRRLDRNTIGTRRITEPAENGVVVVVVAEGGGDIPDLRENTN